MAFDPMPCPDILCIGSVLWDIIGRTDAALGERGDVPGRITRLPGGVALNIAMTLNSSSTVERTWIKDVAHERTHVIKPPAMAAYVAPMTALLQIEIDANMKLTEGK